MYDDIQNPPQQQPISKFKPWFWLLILPLYLFISLWWLSDPTVDWQELLIFSNLPTLSLIMIIFAITMLIWICLKLFQGFSNLAECSHYEVYLAEVFENRDRQRPAQNAMRMDYLRKLRKMNSEVRGDIESRQRQLLSLAIIGLLILLTGSIGLLTGQLMLP